MYFVEHKTYKAVWDQSQTFRKTKLKSYQHHILLRQESYVNIKGYVDILLPVKDRLHAHESCTDRNVRHFHFLQHGRVLTGLLISALLLF